MRGRVVAAILMAGLVALPLRPTPAGASSGAAGGWAMVGRNGGFTLVSAGPAALITRLGLGGATCTFPFDLPAPIAVAPDGTFRHTTTVQALGVGLPSPQSTVPIRAQLTVSGRFTSATSASGTYSLTQSGCATGGVSFTAVLSDAATSPAPSPVPVPSPAPTAPAVTAPKPVVTTPPSTVTTTPPRVVLSTPSSIVTSTPSRVVSSTPPKVVSSTPSSIVTGFRATTDPLPANVRVASRTGVSGVSDRDGSGVLTRVSGEAASRYPYLTWFEWRTGYGSGTTRAQQEQLSCVGHKTGSRAKMEHVTRTGGTGLCSGDAWAQIRDAVYVKLSLLDRGRPTFDYRLVTLDVRGARADGKWRQATIDPALTVERPTGSTPIGCPTVSNGAPVPEGCTGTKPAGAKLVAACPQSSGPNGARWGVPSPGGAACVPWGVTPIAEVLADKAEDLVAAGTKANGAAKAFADAVTEIERIGRDGGRAGGLTARQVAKVREAVEDIGRNRPSLARSVREVLTGSKAIASSSAIAKVASALLKVDTSGTAKYFLDPKPVAKLFDALDAARTAVPQVARDASEARNDAQTIQDRLTQLYRTVPELASNPTPEGRRALDEVRSMINDLKVIQEQIENLRQTTAKFPQAR